MSLCVALVENVSSVALCLESLLNPLSGQWTSISTLCMCTLWSSLWVSLSLCSALLLWVSSLPLLFSLLSLSPSLLPPPQPLSFSICFYVCHCPISAPPSSSSLEENIQKPQRQHPKFILQQLWPRGKGKEKRNGGRSPKVAGIGGVPSRNGAMHLAGGQGWV